MTPRHVVSCYGLEALEQRRLLSAGDLDAGFGVDGRFAETIASVALGASQMLVLDDDRLLTEVHGSNEEGAVEPGRYELRRYTADGMPDATFGNAGVVVGSLPPGRDALAGRLLELPDGKIVALAVSGFDEFLVRFNPDGTLDTTFDDDILRPSLPQIERFADFSAGPGGTLYVATQDHGTGYVYRRLPDGSPDTTFGAAPRVVGGAVAYTGGPPIMKVAPDGKVLLGGSAVLLDDHSLPAVSRLNSDGSPDTGFGDGGTAVLPALGLLSNSVSGFAVLPGGQILVLTRMAVQRAGGEVRGLAVLRLGDDGAIDSSFNGGSGSTFIEGLGSAVAIELDAQGRAIVVGSDGSVRLLSDGTLDPAFGRVAIEIPSIRPTGAGIQSDGRLVVGLHQDFVLPRVNGVRPVGSAILTYGILTDDPAPSPIALDPDTGVLAVSGTDGNDSIDVIERDATLRAVREGFGRAFDVADVERISITGGAGDDGFRLLVHSVPGEVYGGDGRDRITGGEGHDTLYGQGGRDFIDGGLGADLIVGGGGNDQIRGQGGADHIYGHGGNDVIQGNGHNDRIVGGDGADTLFGGAGDDWLIANDRAIDQLFGDAGQDFADADEDDLLTSIESTA